MGKRAVIVGWYGYGNVGDELLLDATLKYFDSRFDSFVYQSPVDLKKKNSSPFPLQNKKDLLRLAKLIVFSDAILLGGGSYLRDVSSKNSLKVKLLLLFLGIIFRKPIYFFGSGLGPFSYNRETWLLKFVFSKVKFPAVRDINSAKLYKQICGKEAMVVPDSVIWYLSNTAPVSVSNGKIGFALREWHDSNMEDKQSSFYQIFIDQLASFMKTLPSGTIANGIVFHNSTKDTFACDQKVYEDVLRQLVNEKTAINIQYLESNLEDVTNKYNEIEILIGMRLHSLIIGAVFKKKLIAISYDPKVKSFMESIGLGEFVIEFEEFTAEKLNTLLVKSKEQEYDLFANMKEGMAILNHHQQF